MKAGRLVLRVVIGGLFIGHGTQKLFGWFGGSGPDGTAQMMSSLDMHPPKRNAIAAGVSETAGGAMLALGLATPAAAAALTGVMLTAVRKVHLPNGPWVANGGYEYNVVLIAAMLAIVDGGPGKYSLDRVLGISKTGPGWALGALAAGAASSAAMIALGKQEAEASAKPDPHDAEAAGES